MEDPVIISFGGGKGGTGKTTLAAVTGSLLAGKGFRTVLVDADLGGANLHMHLGIKRPEKGLSDYLSGRCGSLSEVILKTPVNNLGLISGASDILQVANPKYAQKEKILRNIKGLDTDYILLDLGAGSSIHVSDFFAYFPYGAVVSDTTPE
ncbi:MAG: AAA family ATPase, partial [Chitinivibrionales bacterium]